MGVPLNFFQLRQEVIGTRFNKNQEDSVGRWVNTALQKVWGYADWPFKFTSANLAWTANEATESYDGTDVAKIVSITNDLGDQLKYLSANEFDEVFAWDVLNHNTGTPQAYMLEGKEITLAPIPSGNFSYTIRYMKRAAWLVQDTDEPPWDDEYHFLLVPGAVALGLKLENDPTYVPLEAEFLTQLGEMVDFYMPQTASQNRTYGGPEFWQ